MRPQFNIRTAGVAGLKTLAACSLLVLAQGRGAEAQIKTSNAGDAPVVPGSSAIQGRDLGAAANERDNRMLIAHGVEMAIEGSTLQSLFLQSSGLVSHARVDTRPPLTGVVGSSSVGTVPVVAPAVPVVTEPAITPGAGFTGRAGETVSGRVVGNGFDTPPATTGTVAPVPTEGVVIPEAPITANRAPALLQQHALRSFEAADRMIDMAVMPGSLDEKFQQAARRYASTLRSLTTPPVTRVATTVTTVGPATAVPPPGVPAPAVPATTVAVTRAVTPAAVAPVMGVADLVSIALINHEVKEAIGAMKIRRMIHLMGGVGSPAAQQLATHAQKMDAESRSAIQAFASGAAAPVTTGGAAVQGGSIQALAQQANEMIMAMQAAPPSPSNPTNPVR